MNTLLLANGLAIAGGLALIFAVMEWLQGYRWESEDLAYFGGSLCAFWVLIVHGGIS